QNCLVCGKSGAAITCSEMGCDRSFHLPCAVEGCCVTQYFPHYRSFCCDHRPEQSVQVVPEANTECIICLEPVEDQRSYSTMVCPACRSTWFHRGCIQKMALYTGINDFRCPMCREEEEFVEEMFQMGIRIPIR
ncbi:PHF7 protein, partial [Rhinopomastus cyanomelas]|nr:PHF7 protein [Rhinopomastus cyanomelas]